MRFSGEARRSGYAAFYLSHGCAFNCDLCRFWRSLFLGSSSKRGDRFGMLHGVSSSDDIAARLHSENVCYRSSDRVRFISSFAQRPRASSASKQVGGKPANPVLIQTFGDQWRREQVYLDQGFWDEFEKNKLGLPEGQNRSFIYLLGRRFQRYKVAFYNAITSDGSLCPKTNWSWRRRRAKRPRTFFCLVFQHSRSLVINEEVLVTVAKVGSDSFYQHQP